MIDLRPPSGIVDPRLRLPHFSRLWLVALAAAAIAAGLGCTGWFSRDLLITIEFDRADGLAPGQTQVRYKSVPVGTVQSIRLTDDLSRVQVSARMPREMAGRLTGDARFWVVRPRPEAVGAENMASGAHIEFDPGNPVQARTRSFRGLEQPPGIRADEPGRIFGLRTRRLGMLRPGSAVMFHDVPAGEVLSLDPLTPDGEITLRVFIRAPYDGYVRPGSRFWNISGASVDFGASGLRVEFESPHALMAGGIAFDTPAELLAEPVAASGARFPLYESQDVAIAATSPRRLEFLTYLEGAASGLRIGSPVEIRGIRVGIVTGVDLVYDTTVRGFVVPVRMTVEPGRLLPTDDGSTTDVAAAAARLVADGFRVRLRGGTPFTGRKVLSIDRVPDAPAATIRLENGVIVLPGLGGDGDGDGMTTPAGANETPADLSDADTSLQ